MARRESKLEISMFPFLSVLCSVIGVLMLFMIITISTRVIEAEVAPPLTKTRPGGPLEGSRDGIDEEDYHRIEAEIDRLGALLAERLRQRDMLRRKVAELDDLIELKKTEILVPRKPTLRTGIQLGKRTPVDVVPMTGGRKVAKKPIFIEVKAEGYVAHPAKTSYPPVTRQEVDQRVRFTAEASWKRFLQEVDKNRESEYLLLLLHPNGIEAFDNLRSYLANEFPQAGTPGRSRIDFGKEPFSQDWILFAESRDK